jgi:hypothetical protein
MRGILSTYRALTRQQIVRSGHSPYKGTSSPCNWHSLWPLTRRKVRPWKPLAFYLPELVFTHGQLYVALLWATCVNDISVFCPNGKTMTNVVYTEFLRWSLFSIYCLLFSLDGWNSHIQITGWNSLHWMQKWLQRKLHSRRATIENKMLPKFLLSHRMKTIPT